MKTFEPNKTISELWIDTTRKFVVVNKDWGFNKWDILTLIKDNWSIAPLFKNKDWSENYVYLYNLAYYEEEIEASGKKLIEFEKYLDNCEQKTKEEELKEWDYVYVSDESEEDALKGKYKKILLRKCSDWYVCIQYGFEKEYLKWETFHTRIWDYAVPIHKEEIKKTITLEVTEEQEREINNILKK